jgi:hypothetical protein
MSEEEQLATLAVIILSLANLYILCVYKRKRHALTVRILKPPDNSINVYCKKNPNLDVKQQYREKKSEWDKGMEH